MGSDGWRRVHPSSIWVNLLPRAARFLRAFWGIAVVALLGGREEGRAPLFFGAFLALAVVEVVIGGVFHYLSLRYRFTGTKLEIDSGLLFRRHRTVEASSVQNVELVQTFTHKLAGLWEVRIETASGREAEGLLSALSREDADALVADLSAHRAASAGPAAPERVLVANSTWDLVRYGLTGGGVGVIALAATALLEALESAEELVVSWLLPRVEAAADVARPAAIAVTALAGLAALAVASALVAIVRHHGFVLARAGDALRARRGLLTRHRVELALARVQLVSLEEPVPRRWLGFGSLDVQTAGSPGPKARTGQAEVTVPVLDAARRDEVIGAVLPALPGPLASLALQPAPPAALKRALLGATYLAGAIAAAAFLSFGPGGAVALAAWPLLLAAAALDVRSQGYLVTESLVVARSGFLRRRTDVARRDKLQSVAVLQGPLERRWGLARLRLAVAGAHVLLPPLREADARALLEALSEGSYRTAQLSARPP